LNRHLKIVHHDENVELSCFLVRRSTSNLWKISISSQGKKTWLFHIEQ